MYNVSTEFNNKIKQNSRRIAGKLLLGNLELTPEDIINMNMEYSLGNDGIPAIGGVVASKLEVKLFRDKLPPVLTTQELKPYLGIEVSPGVIEYVPMGVFRISPKDTKKTDKTISLVGYDILFILENSPYNSKLKFPNTLNNIKTELETKGLKFASQALTNVTIKEKPKTIRELLSDISELLGMNVITNKLGEIEFRQLNVVEFDLDANNYYDFKLLADDDVKLTRLTVEKEGEENKDLTYGDDTGYTIKIKNDSITTQNELIAVYNRVFPLSYTAYECDIQGMPHAEVGDIINLTDRHGNKRSIPIAYHRISYSGGLRSEIRANAPSGAISSTGSTGSNSITQSLNDLRVNILEVNTVLADKVSTNELDANVARIEKIINTNLESINAKIKIIETEDLTAINAHITFLKNDVAEINHLLAGNITAENIAVGAITAGSGIIADGAIGDAQISSLSASKLSAGIIDAAIITVKNLNADNITVGTINGQRIADGAIDNSKVAEGANIAGSKLDINDVIININGAETQIDGTKIQVGDRTLDVELSTQKLAIDENKEEISNQRSEIKALDDTIKFKVDNQTFNQYKVVTDNNITTINTQLSKNTASIDILQEEINLKVSQADVEKLISEIDIVGRNLLRYSSIGEYAGGNNRPTSNLTVDGSTIRVISQLFDLVGFTVPDVSNLSGTTLTLSLYTDLDSPITYYKFDNDIQKSKRLSLNNNRFEVQIDVPSGAKNLTIGIGMYPHPSVFEPYYLDRVKLEKGNKATDWTPAPEDIESEITAINTKVAGIDITLDDITSRVSSTESKIIKVNDEVSAIESRVSIAEQKITDDSIINTVRSSTAYKGDLNTITNQVTTVEQLANQLEINVKDYTDGKLSGATYTFDGNYATFKGAGLRIQNKLGQNVLQGDINGDLQLVGNFTTYSNGNKALEMKRQILHFYDWEGTTREEPVGLMYSSRHNGSADTPGIAIANEKNSHLSIVYGKNPGYQPYIDFDKDNTLGYSKDYPIIFWENSLFTSSAMFEYMIYLGKRNKIFQSTNNALVLEVNDGSVERGLTIQGDTSGKVLEFRPWHKEEIMLWRTTKVNKDFLVVGSKNAVVNTKNYGERLQNALETAEYYFKDIGSGRTDETGYCYIYIEDIFSETVNTNMQYYVDVQKYGTGDIYPIKRTPVYFVIKGTPNLEFGWTLTAKRVGYEYDRLEQIFDKHESAPTSLDWIMEDETIKEDNEELKTIIDKELSKRSDDDDI